MKVKQLIDALGIFDPEAEFFVNSVYPISMKTEQRPAFVVDQYIDPVWFPNDPYIGRVKRIPSKQNHVFLTFEAY